MKTMIHRVVNFAGILLLARVALFPGIDRVALRADPPGVNTNRKSPVVLPLPRSDDVFHFVVFGDRTGGPAEGIKVLAQAVTDTNLLDPDLILTVGDLVNGYNQTAPWIQQMEEFRATMNQLKRPWFPVAGNHGTKRSTSGRCGTGSRTRKLAS